MWHSSGVFTLRCRNIASFVNIQCKETPVSFQTHSFPFSGHRVGPEKVFNEAGSRCCNIIKIVELNIFSTGSGASPYKIQYIYIYIYSADKIQLAKVSRLGIKYLAKIIIYRQTAVNIKARGLV